MSHVTNDDEGEFNQSNNFVDIKEVCRLIRHQIQRKCV